MGRRERTASMAGCVALAAASLGASGCFGLGEDFERAVQLAFFEFYHLASPWSPEGDRILIGGGLHGLACVDITSGETLSLAGPGVTLASFAPDGRSILCAGLLGEERTGLWIESTDGGERASLVEERGTGDWLFSLDSAAWSPDGRWIAVSAGKTLELVRPDLEERRGLFTGGGLRFAWSPDGRWLACNGPGSTARSLGLHLVSIDTGERRLLADGIFPSWSPDGRELAYMAVVENVWQGVHVIAARGGASRFLCEGSFPRWSPRADELLVQRHEDGKGRIIVVAADGSRERLLTRGTTGWWSPDGSRVSFYRGAELFVVDADGTNERSLGRSPPGPLDG